MRLRTSTTKTAAVACATACLTAAAFAAAPPSAAEEGPTTLTADPMATWQTDGIVWSLAYARGVVYVGGTFTSVRPPGAAPGEKEKPRTNFAAFDAETGALLPCAPAFSGESHTVRAMKPSRDGSVLYVGGSFSKAGTAGVASAVALDTSDCSLRKDFRPAVAATVRAIDVTDKAVYLGGDFTKVGGRTRNRIAALSPSGELLPFHADLDEPVRAITAAEKDGKVLVGGDFSWVNDDWAHALVALDPSTGSIVQTYDHWIQGRSVVKALANDGTNFYLGAEGFGDWGFDGRIAGDLATGEMVWEDSCQGATQAVVPYKGILYSGSHAHECGDTPGGFPEHKKRHHFLANSIEDRTIQYWFPDTNDGIGEQLGPRAMVMANGILWSGGEFTTVNDKPQQGLTRFGAGPDTGAPDVPELAVTSTSATENELSWRASWDRDDADLTYKIYRDGALLESLTQRSAYWDRPQMHFTDTVAANARHHYSIAVTDGDNSSPQSEAVTATAGPAEAGTAGSP